MREELQIKVQRAIKLLQTVAKTNTDIELAYSGGKDSDVILELARMAGIPFTAIYKNTTIDPPYTLQHCKENGVQIMQPKITFFKMIEKHGFPSRFARFCCSELKEYKIKDTAILGIRREESRARAKRYNEPIVCRIYGKCSKGSCAKNHVNQVLPILDWTKQDVEDFIIERGIKLHPLYYRDDGSIDCSRRLGCMGCPLQSDRGLADFKANPRLVRAWLRAGKAWWEAPREKPLKAKKWSSDIYEFFVMRTFHDSISEMTINKESLFPTDWKAALEQYFGIKLD
ncbi:MAG: phosphoadenosine phosphosulfate reductase family protein [Paludibacteraceae bacterium]|nr:phosphoadenosine phosphosulfate reductase family protein [Paludibacteraceae bacterium]